MAEADRPPGWLAKAEFDSIFSRVPRLCVEVVVVDPERGVLLTRREIPPNVGSWHIAGGTVLFAEPVVEAVKRVARAELGFDVHVGDLLGYIEYPSHFENGLDSPVGLAFEAQPLNGAEESIPEGSAFFRRLPPGLYEEQRAFLVRRLGFS